MNTNNKLIYDRSYKLELDSNQQNVRLKESGQILSKSNFLNNKNEDDGEVTCITPEEMDIIEATKNSKTFKNLEEKRDQRQTRLKILQQQNDEELELRKVDAKITQTEERLENYMNLLESRKQMIKLRHEKLSIKRAQLKEEEECLNLYEKKLSDRENLILKRQLVDKEAAQNAEKVQNSIYKKVSDLQANAKMENFMTNAITDKLQNYANHANNDLKDPIYMSLEKEIDKYNEYRLNQHYQKQKIQKELREIADVYSNQYEVNHFPLIAPDSPDFLRKISQDLTLKNLGKPIEADPPIFAGNNLHPLGPMKTGAVRHFSQQPGTSVYPGHIGFNNNNNNNRHNEYMPISMPGGNDNSQFYHQNVGVYSTLNQIPAYKTKLKQSHSVNNPQISSHNPTNNNSTSKPIERIGRSLKKSFSFKRNKSMDFMKTLAARNRSKSIDKETLKKETKEFLNNANLTTKNKELSSALNNLPADLIISHQQGNVQKIERSNSLKLLKKAKDSRKEKAERNREKLENHIKAKLLGKGSVKESKSLKHKESDLTQPSGFGGGNGKYFEYSINF